MTEANKAAISASKDHVCEAYKKLRGAFTNIFHLFSIKEILALDILTNMPSGAVAIRSAQISNLSRRVYADIVNPAMPTLLDEAEADAKAAPEVWDQWDLANLREMRRIYTHFVSNPPELYSMASKISAEGTKIFTAALESKNWTGIIPHLTSALDVQRKILADKKNNLGFETEYDVVLDSMLRGLSCTQMDQLVDQVLPVIRDLCAKNAPRKGSAAVTFGTFPRGDQMEFARRIMEDMGFDFNRGRLFVTNHRPASGGTVFDTRLLVRCEDNSDFKRVMEDTFFHGASALYIQGLPREWVNQPVCEDLGSAMLEAQGLLLETIIGRSRKFMAYIGLRGKEILGQIDTDALYSDLNRPFKTIGGTERGELGSLPYLIISYRIERDLINGHLTYNELPARWRKECQELLGEDLGDDMQVFIQNPGWISGRFGMNVGRLAAHMIAAALHESLLKDKPDVMDSAGKGDLAPLSGWLRETIWSKGRLYPTQELLKTLRGEKLSAGAFIAHLTRRFGS